jgi:2-oxoglutarate dehydrogenase E2 component (dihydrolipoamide succinyltransferase)
MDDVSRRDPIRVPDLGTEPAELMLSVWLVPLGAPVATGDRVVEILTGEAVVDLPAPSRGILAEKLVAEDSVIHTGQILGWVQRLVPSLD